VKKTIFSALVLSFVCLLFLFTPTTYAADQHSASRHPSASGGGCQTKGNGTVTIGACINYDGSALNSDAYITIPSNIASSSTCSVEVDMLDGSGGPIDGISYTCSSGKNYYGPVSDTVTPGNYYTEVYVSYNSTTFSEDSQIISV
jgi:hypothetical protein